MLTVEALTDGAPAAVKVKVDYRDIVRSFEEVARCAASPSVDGFDGLLELVGRKLCDLLEVRRCGVYLAGDDGLFHCRAGFSSAGSAPVIGLVAGTQADGFTREIVESRAPVVAHDAQNDPRPIRLAMKRHRVLQLIGVPLVIDDEVAAIIFADSDRPDAFSDDDIAAARTFATLASLAVRTARQSCEVSQKLSVIERQRSTLDQLIDGQQMLSKTVSEGADAGRLLTVLARLVGKPVALYDADLRLLSISNNDPAHRQAASVLAEAARELEWVGRTISKLDASQRTTVLPPAIANGLGWRHLISAVTLDGAVTGFVAVLEIGCPLSINDVRLTELLATIVGLVLHVDLQTSQSAAWLGAQLLSDLVVGAVATAELRRRALALGVDLDLPHILVRIEHSEVDDAHAQVIGRDIAADLRVSLGGRPVLWVTGDDAHIALAPAHDGEPAVRRAVTRVAERLRRSGVEVMAAISAVGREPGDYATAAAALRTLLRVSGDPAAVVSLQDCGLFGFLAHDGALQLARLAGRDLLEPLVDHDRINDSNLVMTLRAFLEGNGQIREAAKSLSVHENTVRYRLSRIRELSRIDPARVDSLLEARLALRVHDLS